MAFPPLENYNHVVVSVSIHFPSYSQQDTPFHCTPYDYSHAELNCFCGMVGWQNMISLISSWGHCQRSSPLQIFHAPQAGFGPVQNLSSGLVEWSCAIVITTTPRHHFFFGKSGTMLIGMVFVNTWKLPHGRISLNSVLLLLLLLLLLLVNFVCAFRLELMCISLIKSIRSSVTYLHGVQLLVLLP